MCDEGETADQADAVRTESQKMESRAGETALDGSARSIIVLIVVGMLVGVLSGMFGIGGGTVIVPALVWLGLSQRNAAATSTLAIVPTSISGVVSYATRPPRPRWRSCRPPFPALFRTRPEDMSTGSPRSCCSAVCSSAGRLAAGCCRGCRNWCCGGFSWRFSCSW